METRDGHQMVKPEVLQISFPEGEIRVLPEEVILGTDGRLSIRRIKTGKKSGDEFDHIEYTLLMEAAEVHYGTDAKVEVVHLAGETQEMVSLSDRRKTARLARTKSAMAEIIKGSFPARPEHRTCPRCPNFFICGDVPPGTVCIKN